MKRITICFFLLQLCLLTGCSESESIPLDSWGRPIVWDGPPQPSWQEWAAHQAQLREGLPSGYRPNYLPEMDGWGLNEILPAEAFAAPLRDICELPEAEQTALRRLRVEEPDELARLLEYAERGYVHAMMRLGDDFCSFPWSDSPALSRAEGLAWAQRAAVSGEPYASLTLAYCMNTISMEDDHEAAGLPPAQIKRNSLWFDQVVYWFWRAAHGLEPVALYELFRGTENFYFPDFHLPSTVQHRPEKAIETYKWLRLAELSAALHGSAFGMSTQEALERWPQMSEAEIAEAERRVAAFLRNYGGVLRRARYRGYNCPGELDFDWLNEELARYGLQVEPERPWSPLVYPLAPLQPLEPVPPVRSIQTAEE